MQCCDTDSMRATPFHLDDPEVASHNLSQTSGGEAATRALGSYIIQLYVQQYLFTSNLHLFFIVFRNNPTFTFLEQRSLKHGRTGQVRIRDSKPSSLSDQILVASCSRRVWMKEAGIGGDNNQTLVKVYTVQNMCHYSPKPPVISGSNRLTAQPGLHPLLCPLQQPNHHLAAVGRYHGAGFESDLDPLIAICPHYEASTPHTLLKF